MKSKRYIMISMNLQKKIRKEEDCLKACIKRQMITSNAKEGGNVYQILRHANKWWKKRITWNSYPGISRDAWIYRKQGKKHSKNTFDWNRNNIAAFADELVSRKEDLGERIHIIEALQWAQNHSEQIIEVIEGAEDYYDARAKVMETFGFDRIQAQSVTEMRVRTFCEIEKRNYPESYKNLGGKWNCFKNERRLN